MSDEFNAIHCLNRDVEADQVVKLIESYFEDVDSILSDLSLHLDASNITNLSALAHEIEDKSTSIGAQHVRIACPELIQACDENNKIK
ncbi:histidine-containing phosphotransfer protein 1-like [Senna tora]|uniref:Histidine-containing phosphotransfer protein n=1 Tax=Senna tora TaxID=362788 RepID=A0A834TLW2_9FABA|nr:histidine-containing phosphotransfer protein 1-like [Senna tora]